MLAAAALALTGCSSPSAKATTTTRSASSTTATTSRAGAALVTLPTASFTRSYGGYPLIVAAHGSGDRTLGRYRITGHDFVIQTVCKGAEPLEIVGLETEGPCDNLPGVLTTRPAHSGWFRVTVKAPAKTEWAIYMTQER